MGWRSPDAPHLSLSLSAAPQLSMSGRFEVTITVHHHADDAVNPDGKPITFEQTYLYDLVGSNRYGLFLREDNNNNTTWKRIPEDPACGLSLTSAPDDDDDNKNKVVVGQDSNFLSLKPGESHSTTRRIYPDHEFVEDFEVGKTYSFRYLGGEISWWDWGTKEVS